MKATHDLAPRDARLDAIERFSKPSALLVSILLAIVLILPIVTTVSGTNAETLRDASWILWAYLSAEYLFRFAIAKEKLRFVLANLIDLAVVVIPLFTPLLPFAQFAQPLRAIRVIVVLLYALRDAENVFVARNFPYAVIIVVITFFVCSLLEYGLEHNAPHGNIRTVGDSLWWAAVTITTVGYGDFYPVTAAGRGVAVVLMLVGISFAGVLAASLVSIFIRNDRLRPQGAGVRDVERRLTDMEAKLDLLLGRANGDPHASPGGAAPLPADTSKADTSKR